MNRREEKANPLAARISKAGPAGLALVLALGWASREASFARERGAEVMSKTVTLEQLKLAEFRHDAKRVGAAGAYLEGETPASSKFVTGRFVIDAGRGKSPHPPHRHVEEEVMIVESGQAEIFCDGKTTKVGPGSVMFTTPNAPHGIVNSGDTPVVFYFIKWAAKGTK
jgi:mannose-6-phosphate isomerase-like protein (cupin superfamily)